MDVPRASTTESLVEDFKEIHELLSRLNVDRDMIVRNYPQWEKQRKTTINVNKKFLNELSEVYKKCIVGRGVGTGVGILGGLAAVTGFFLSFKESTRELGEELTKYGTAVGVVGGATSFSACVAEGWLSKGILDEVKAALEKDQQLTEKLFPCLQRSEDLDSLFEKVFGTSILSFSVQDFFTVVDEIQIIVKEGVNTYKDISKALSSSIELYSSDPTLKNIVTTLQRLGEKVRFSLIEFCENPRVREAILKVYQSFKKAKDAFEFLKTSLSVMRDMRRMLRNGIYSSLISTICSYARPVNTWNQALFLGIKLAVDIVNIISLADDIKNGKSKHSKMLEEVNALLSLELTEMNRAYLSIV